MNVSVFKDALLKKRSELGAIGLTWAISRYALDIPFRPLIGLSVAGVVITASVVATVGVVSSWEVLQRKPLATLRAE